MNSLLSEPRVRPIVGRGVGLKTLGAVLLCGTVYWLYHCFRILSEGLSTLGIDTYGATWGILVVNTVHLIGISHVGIAISAAVRVLRLRNFRNVARSAEFVTLITLVAALTNLLLHLGRPDRLLVNVFLHGKWHSPMVWSMTVFVAYFSTSAIYLYLSLRRDLWTMAGHAPRARGLYRVLALGYTDSPAERARHERALYWLALCLIPIMISVHSVYGLLFGMLSARAGWYNPLQAPYFVLGAIVSGFSAIIVIVAILRRVYAWRFLLSDRMFRAFGAFLSFMVFLYLYFMLSEHMTAHYLPTAAERAVSSSLLSGTFATLFWATTVVGLIIPFVYLFIQSVNDRASHVGLIAGASFLVNVALWLKRYLLVVPSQYHPHIDIARPPVEYVPTHTEWVAVLGTYVAAALIFVLLLRVFPMVAFTEPDSPRHASGGKSIRQPVTLGTFVVGVALIAWGVMTRSQDLAAAKWILGVLLLVAVPLEHVLIGDRVVEPVVISPSKVRADT